ncbi:MAG TPA: hypothetical protein VKP30_26445, partial [Polyangiaceae bacterium]|nr:hypothetical protein [Polyangiaceae bacterium]
ELGTPVLLEFEQSSNPKIRQLVVELACLVLCEQHCRLFLRRLSDSEQETHDFAAAQVSRCHYRSLVPDLIRAGNAHTEPAERGPIARALGQSGTPAEIPVLKQWRSESHSGQEVHDIDLALARLGDAPARAQLARDLREGSAWTRVDALRDCLYIADPSLVREFGPALKDRTDVMALSIPENPPILYARVADIATSTMLQLGIRLSFSMDPLRRLDETQLEEAEKYVARMQEK